MVLSETGESRIRGYLFVLERSLRTFLPRDTVTDAVREIESHLRERIATSSAMADERSVVERILTELGSPLRVAQAYSAERTFDEAIATGRVVPVLRSIWHLAFTTITGFFAALWLFVGYTVGAAFLVIAGMKPLFPDNVGLWVRDDDHLIRNFGARFPVPANEHVIGGYWVIVVSLILGLGLLVLTHRGARRFIAWWRARLHWRESAAS